jgi:hypothetical protein
VQEPVAQDVQEKCRIEDVPAKGGLRRATPPAAQRQWVGLTDEEYDAICDKHSAMSDFDFLEDIEAKLKEKNNG